jgi:hypothetical protein
MPAAGFSNITTNTTAEPVIDDVAGFESYTFLGPNFQVFPLVGLVCEPKFGPEASGVKSLKVKTKLKD